MTTSSEKESIFMQFSIVGKTFDYPDTLYALEMIGTVPHLLYSISFNWFYDLKCMGYTTNYQYGKNRVADFMWIDEKWKCYRTQNVVLT